MCTSLALFVVTCVMRSSLQPVVTCPPHACRCAQQASWSSASRRACKRARRGPTAAMHRHVAPVHCSQRTRPLLRHRHRTALSTLLAAEWLQGATGRRIRPMAVRRRRRRRQPPRRIRRIGIDEALNVPDQLRRTSCIGPASGRCRQACYGWCSKGYAVKESLCCARMTQGLVDCSRTRTSPNDQQEQRHA